MNTQQMVAAGPTGIVPAVQSETGALIHMIERVARDPSADLDKLERLMEMRKQIQLEEAEGAFNEHMSVVQSKMRAIAADANNPQTKSKYASYFALDKAIRPIYSGEGFGLSFNTDEGAPTDYVRIVCYVSRGKFTRKYHVDMPADGKGAKGGDVMTKTHATGAAMTYGQRYLLKMIFNIAIGEDDDGNAAGRSSEPYTPPPGAITDDQTLQLRDALEAKGASVKAFLAWAKQKRIEDIPAEHYQSCVDAIANFRRA